LKLFVIKSIYIFISTILNIYKFKLAKIKYLLLLIFLFSISQTVLSQIDSLSSENNKEGEYVGKFRYIELKGHTGLHMYSGESLDGF